MSRSSAVRLLGTLLGAILLTVGYAPVAQAAVGVLQATNFVVTQEDCVDGQRSISFSFDYTDGPDGWFIERNPLDEGAPVSSGSVSQATGSVSGSAGNQPAGTHEYALYGSRGGQPIATSIVSLEGCVLPGTVSTGGFDWAGNGSENADPGCQGAQRSRWLWTLATDSNNTLESGALAVVYRSGAQTTTQGVPSGDGRVIHFNVSLAGADVVSSASVSYKYVGDGRGITLTLTSSKCTGKAFKRGKPVDVCPSIPGLQKAGSDCTPRSKKSKR